MCFDTSVEDATVKKLILHGNVPGSISFQKYHRCRWKLHPSSSSTTNNSSFSEDDGEATSELKFDRFSSHYISSSQPPMLLNRTVESLSNSVELIGEISPTENENLAGLALTKLYGCPGLVFEVMKNNSVASLTLY